MQKILPADILSPILAYMRIQGDHKVILESIPRDSETARFSIQLITQSLKFAMKMAS